MEGKRTRDIGRSAYPVDLSAVCQGYARQRSPRREGGDGESDQASAAGVIPPFEYFEFWMDVVVTGEEREEDVRCVVDWGCGRGVCASVELKGSPFV